MQAIAKGCPKLEVLVLSGCEEVGDAACEAILQHCSQIQEIELSDSAVTDKSLTVATHLDLAKQLRRLAVDGCAVTQDVVLSLQKAKPDLEVML